MASIDINSTYKKATSKIEANQTYVEAKSNINRLKKKVGSVYEEDKKKIVSQLNNAKQFANSVKNFRLSTQFDELFRILSITSGQGSNTTAYVKNILIQALPELKKGVLDILTQEMFKSLGCSQNQTYVNQTIWVPVSSIDLNSIFTLTKDSKQYKLTFETASLSPLVRPFPMNKQLYELIQNPNQSFYNLYSINYKGGSSQDLFNIEYTTTGQNGQPGNFFKVTLFNRYNNLNSVYEFVSDYLATIEIIDNQLLVNNIMDILCGAFSISVNIGVKKVEDKSKFLLLLQRILGMCFDNKQEIDVSGVAKIPETDGSNQDFFEFSEIDLRNIESRVDNVKRGVIVLEDCNNAVVPVDFDAILNSLLQLNFVDGPEFVSQVNSTTETLITNPEWVKLDIDLNIARQKIDLDFIKNIIHGIVMTVLSPKVLLPLVTMTKALQQNLSTEYDTFMTFMKKFQSFMINFTSKVGALFVKILYDIIARDIKLLLKQIINDINRDYKEKWLNVILTLIQVVTAVSNLVTDYRQCKNVIDDIMRILDIVSSIFARAGRRVPLPLLFASSLLSGYSVSRAFADTILQLQVLGLPTGPLPDGSPNLGLAAIYASIQGQANEQFANGRADVPIPALKIPSPAGPLFTIPVQTSGKYL